MKKKKFILLRSGKKTNRSKINVLLKRLLVSTATVRNLDFLKARFWYGVDLWQVFQKFHIGF